MKLYLQVVAVVVVAGAEALVGLLASLGHHVAEDLVACPVDPFLVDPFHLGDPSPGVVEVLQLENRENVNQQLFQDWIRSITLPIYQWLSIQPLTFDNYLQ